MRNYQNDDELSWTTGMIIGVAFLFIITLVVLCFIKFAKWEPKYKVPINDLRSAQWKEFNSNM